MNILLINGSPKRMNSNTMKLSLAFLEGAGWDNAEIINISDLEIDDCLGCFACWNQTPGECIIKDDMAEVLSKLISADTIIWSFPLYFFSIPGALKKLIDRQLPLSLPFMAKGNKSGGHPSRYDLTHQKHIIISTCGFWTASGNYDAVISTFDHIYGPDNYTKIFCGQGELFAIPELRNQTDNYLELVRMAGAEYASGVISQETEVLLNEPLFPRDVFEKMADASWLIKEKDNSEELLDDSLNFTTQMAALYKADGAERILEFFYTDINKRYQIILTKQGSELITENFKPYTTKIETPYSLWRSIARGEINGQDALFQRLYKVKGDFSLMLKWDVLFGASATTKQTSTKNNKIKRSNMIALLLPWISIWIAMPINPIAGGITGITAASIVPILWFLFSPVAFEQISLPIVAGLSVAALLNIDTSILIPLSYLSFGLIWLAGSFTKIPLTANYSASGYGDESAFDNPLFMRTNRILTAVWGMLYVLSSIWTYFLLSTNLSAYTGLINSIAPILLGIFTSWFQKWYPTKWARG